MRRLDRYKTFENKLVYDLDYILKSIRNYTKENSFVNVKIDTEKDNGSLEKISLSSTEGDEKNSKETITIEDNDSTNDFYNIDVNGTKEANVPTEQILVTISKIFDSSKYND